MPMAVLNCPPVLQHSGGGGDERLGIDVQPFQDLRGLARNVALLALTDHAAGGVDEFQIVVAFE